MIPEDQIRTVIRSYLSARGLIISDIPRSDTEKRPDFLVSEGKHRVIIELKTKGDDTEELVEKQNALANDTVFMRSEESLRRNRMSSIIANGVTQLAAYHAEPDAFRMLWLHSAGQYADLSMQRFQNTLYGAREIIHVEKQIPGRWCYYFDTSDFYLHRDILVGAIISRDGEVLICLNDLSTRIDAFRQSGLPPLFADQYCDPLELEQSGDAYRVDGNVDRRDSQAVKQYIVQKYNCGRILDLNMKHYSAEIVVKK
jgi:hypothetical protein